MAEFCTCLMRTKSYITQNGLWTSSDACGCVRQWPHYFSSISLIGLCFWVFKMFFYDSYLILDHNQVHSSWIFIEHLIISVSNSALVYFSSFHYTDTYCLRFFMTHCLVQIFIWKIGEVEAKFHVFWHNALWNSLFYAGLCVLWCF